MVAACESFKQKPQISKFAHSLLANQTYKQNVLSISKAPTVSQLDTGKCQDLESISYISMGIKEHVLTLENSNMV